MFCLESEFKYQVLTYFKGAIANFFLISMNIKEKYVELMINNSFSQSKCIM